MSIFGKLFGRNKILEEVMIVESLPYDEMLKIDMKEVNELSDQLLMFGRVLTLGGESFCNSISISKQEDYPIATMEKISKCHKYRRYWSEGESHINHFYMVEIEHLCMQRCYTHEGAMLFIEKYYEIRERHLKELFPAK